MAGSCVRSAMCVPPIPRRHRTLGHVLPGEESASLLLWAWPRLLGWPRTVNWLFSPVVGNSHYPGDLWGLDSRGDLLIVETKLSRAGEPQDPMADFVGYLDRSNCSDFWMAESLEKRWHGLLRAEETFVREQLKQLTPEAPLTGTHRGVLPYSSHRDAVWRWQALFRQRILPRFAAGEYRRAVERSLRGRALRGNRPPTFVGVIATLSAKDPRLSGSGKSTLGKLRSRVGANRTFLRALSARLDSSNRIRIRSWTLQR